MGRLGLLGVALLASACAQAGAPGSGGGVDASTHGDGSRPVDARPLDAMVDLCKSTATCMTAINLGTVSGDTGAGMLSASGYQAAWYRVRVTEDNGSPVGQKLSLTTRLISPANTNYNVFVYVNADNDVLECTTPTGTATMTGTTDSLQIKWGEGTISNGDDDSRNVSIEIRPISGSCSAAQPWQLSVQGDT